MFFWRSCVRASQVYLWSASNKMKRFVDLFISINCSTCFRRFLRPSSGVQTVHTASGIFKPILLPAAIVDEMELRSISSIYVFQAVSPPIIRSKKLYIQRQVLSNQYCCLLLSWMRWNFAPSHPHLTLYVQYCTPDDGRRKLLKHVE